MGSRPHSNICRSGITAELAKIQAGRTRISAASERLDKTVEELGHRFRTDVPQGEKSEVMVQHQPIEQRDLMLSMVEMSVEFVLSTFSNSLSLVRMALLGKQSD